MNVLQVTSRLDSGDASRDTINLTRFLTLNGHKAIVASPASAFVGEIDEVGARHYAMEPSGNIFLMPFFIARLGRIIERENIDIVHSRDAASSFACFFSARLKGRPFIATVYGGAAGRFFGRMQFWAKRVICSSEIQARDFIKKGLLVNKKARVIPPSVSVHEERSSNEKPEASLTVAALFPLVSTDVRGKFMASVSALSRSIYRLKVFVMDSSPPADRESLEKLRLLMKRHSLDDIIEILPRGEERRALESSDVLLHIGADDAAPSRLALEAMARGVALLATPARWLTEYFGGEDGAYFSCRLDSRDIASRITQIHKDKKLKYSVTRKARDTVRERFNAKNNMNSVLDIYGEARSRKSILIIKIGALGDVILSIPSLRAIRKKFPGAEIKLLTGLDKREIFARCPFIDEVLVCDFSGRDRGVAGLLRVAKKLRSHGFDIVVDLQNNKKSHLLSYLSAARERYGYDNKKMSFLLNRRVKGASARIEPVEHQSKVLRLLGIFDVDKALEFWPSEEDEKWADDFLASYWVPDGTDLVAVNLSSSRRWATKAWPPEYFAEVCNRLAKEKGIRALLIGAGKRNAFVDKFIKRAKCKPIDALGKTSVSKLISLLKRCSLLISSDSAPIHIAAGVGTPFIAIFGPTDPKRHVLPVKESVIIRKKLRCSPCYRTHCPSRHECMRSVKPDEVYEALLGLLDTGGNKKGKSQNSNLKTKI